MRALCFKPSLTFTRCVYTFLWKKDLMILPVTKTKLHAEGQKTLQDACYNDKVRSN